jgi:hypothetical protein
VIETFKVRKDFPVTAIQYVGAPNSTWEATYGFVLNDGKGGYYQVERLIPMKSMGASIGEESTQHTYLNFSNNKRSSVFAFFNDWPSYEATKKVVFAIHGDPSNRLAPILTMTNPADRIAIVHNSERVQPAKADP